MSKGLRTLPAWLTVLVVASVDLAGYALHTVERADPCRCHGAACRSDSAAGVATTHAAGEGDGWTAGPDRHDPRLCPICSHFFYALAATAAAPSTCAPLLVVASLTPASRLGSRWEHTAYDSRGPPAAAATIVGAG